MTWIFLHGLGQAPSAWQPVLRRLESELTVHCPSLSELAAGDPRYPALLSALETALDSIPGPLHLCGLSLGGVLAMDYALRHPLRMAEGVAHRHPERVASLVLCGTPLTMPRNLLRLQDFLFRLMPERAFAGSGFSREAMRQLAGSMAELDLRPRLPELSCPVLVLCGSKDRANRKAARALAEQLPQARLHWIAGAGHEANLDSPEVMAELLRGFYQSLS